MAGRIPQQFIDDLLSRIDIVDVISARVPLKKSGSNYSARCPFHNEKTPSFTVSQTKQFYHCFGCHANGTAISFMMNYDQLHFVDAVETLAESIGLEVPREGVENEHENSRKPLFAIMERCARYYYEQLKMHSQAIAYLKNRRLSGEIAKKFGLGYAPAGWNNLQETMPDETATLLTLGMQIKKSGGGVYDRFRDRIMFPIRDRRGRVIAFGGRILDKGEPKYLNSPETDLFHKGEELYGYYEARKAAQDIGEIIIVEGYMDVIALAEHGVENAVATLGTATTNYQIESLFRTVPSLVFCFDGDKAGKQAAWRALKACLPALRDGRDAHFAFLEQGDDPDSFITNHGRDAFENFIKQAIPLTDFMLQHLAHDLDITEVGGKARLANLAKPLIDTLPQGIYKKLTVKNLESVIGTSLDSTTRKQAGAGQVENKDHTRKADKLQNARSAILRRAATLLLQNPTLGSLVRDPDNLFDNESVGGEIFSKLIRLCKSHSEINTAGLLEHFRETPHFDGLSRLAYQPLLPNKAELSDEGMQQEFKDIMLKLKQYSLKKDARLVHPSQRKGLLSIPGKQNSSS